MPTWTALGVALAGVAAGVINVVAGSGTLIAFPALLLAGCSPVVANTSSKVGLVFGAVSGCAGYRHELRRMGRSAVVLWLVGVAGGTTGAALLIWLPGQAFAEIAPYVVLLATGSILLSPLLRRLPARTHGDGLPSWAALLLATTYGGYFGAGQGIIYLSLLGRLLRRPVQDANAAKNLVAMGAGISATTVFVVTGGFDVATALLLAAGSAVGGVAGASVSRRLPARAFRAVVVAAGLAASVALLV